MPPCQSLFTSCASTKSEKASRISLNHRARIVTAVLKTMVKIVFWWPTLSAKIRICNRETILTLCENAISSIHALAEYANDEANDEVLDRRTRWAGAYEKVPKVWESVSTRKKLTSNTNMFLLATINITSHILPPLPFLLFHHQTHRKNNWKIK